MSETEAPGHARDAGPVGADPSLTPDRVEAILADFRDWLREQSLDPPPAAPPEPVDLHTLVAQFTALRHEVNLQTRAVRQQQELNTETLRQYAESLRRHEASPAPRESPADSDERVKALLATLIDVADTQILAARETARVSATIKTQIETPPPPAKPVAPTFLGRLLGIGRLAEQQNALIAEIAARSTGMPNLRRIGETIDGAASGLTLGLQRIERAMARHGLEPVAVVGRPFDPETMEAVEAISDSGRPPGEVLDELRRGYLMNGIVFRFAQVRVAK